jgi:hypothetical protein
MTDVVTSRLLADALEAHGGLERWRGFTGMSSVIVTGGQLWDLKGVSLIATPRLATTDFRQQRTTVFPFGEADWTMTWTPEHVAIRNGAGEVVAERDDPRSAFAGHAYDTPWDPLHLAYFNGYAMWTYHALPFILAEPGYEVVEIAPIEFEGAMLRGLEARFPPAIHSHTRTQRFYFGSDGLLRRHDYEVDVWAGTAAAHLLSDYYEVDGIQLPRRRSVFLRTAAGALDHSFNAVTVDMSDYAFR